MSSESEEIENKKTAEDNADETKKEHIQQRLKDLGVSDDSVRPKKSWLSRYGNHILVTIAIVLSVIYWLEYRAMESEADAVASNENQQGDVKQATFYPAVNRNQQGMPNQMEWQKRQKKYQENLKKAQKEQEALYKEWQKEQKALQQKAWEAWNNYVKKQQAINKKYMQPNTGNPKGNFPANINNNPQAYGFNAAQQPYRNQAPPSRYQQPYKQNPYYNRW